MDDDKIEDLYKDKTKDSYSFLATKDKVETIHKKDDKDVFYNVIEKDKIESVYKKDDAQIAKITIDDAKIETLYKDISSAVMEDADITVKYKDKAKVLMDDNHIAVNTMNCKADMNNGNYLLTALDADIDSVAPVGINLGLYKTGLGPYLTAETAAAKALSQAASQAAPPLAILDALSGGTGLIIGLGAAIVAFCTAMQAADSAAHESISLAVK
jgi:hypothetical protein